MSRDSRVYLEDILEAIRKIRKYVGLATKEKFFADEKTLDAVLRNLEIIGEAVKHIPDATRKSFPGIEWKKIAGLRDILGHEYFSINHDIIWDILETKLDPLESEVKVMTKGKKKA